MKTLFMLVQVSFLLCFCGSLLGGEYELIEAVKNGQYDIAKNLIEKGAYVNARDASGCTPLHWACGKGYANIAKLLLEKGASINAQEYQFNLTPLHCAAGAGCLEIAELLIQKGANINAEAHGIYIFTPLHCAASQGRTEMVKYLIKKGANVNAEKGGYTPLDVAANKDGSRNIEMEQIIREAGGKSGH